MPDTAKETVSATQVSALFNRSPYLDRWMLWHHFVDDLDVSPEPNIVMEIGTLCQPVIHELVRRRYKLDVQDNSEDTYFKRGPLGCTPDGIFKDPTRGEGIVEAKCVSYPVFKNDWKFNGTECVGAPDHIEIQVQVQMMVLERPWAILAALVGGNDLVTLERKPDEGMQGAILEEATRFLESVRDKVEPPAFGDAMELPALRKLYPQVEEEPLLELVGDEGLAMDEWLDVRQDASERRLLADKAYKGVTAQILSVTKTHARVKTPGYWVNITKGKATRITAREVKE